MSQINTPPILIYVATILNIETTLGLRMHALLKPALKFKDNQGLAMLNVQSTKLSPNKSWQSIFIGLYVC